jgi:hypothetical protein
MGGRVEPTATPPSRPRTTAGSAPRPFGPLTTNVPRSVGERKRPLATKAGVTAVDGGRLVAPQRSRPSAAVQPPKFMTADDFDASKENADAAIVVGAVVRTPPSSPAKRRPVPAAGRKRTSDAAALDEATDVRLELAASPQRRPAAKRSSLGSQVPPTWVSSSSASASSDGVEPGSSQLSSGSRSKLERLRFRPTAA